MLATSKKFTVLTSLVKQIVPFYQFMEIFIQYHVINKWFRFFLFPEKSEEKTWWLF